MSVIEEIAAERRRQKDVEGWTEKHDDRHEPGELSAAGACYALAASTSDEDREAIEEGDALPEFWPWAPGWWKPKDRRRDLIRSAALIVAEIERLDRARQQEPRHDR